VTCPVRSFDFGPVSVGMEQRMCIFDDCGMVHGGAAPFSFTGRPKSETPSPARQTLWRINIIIRQTAHLRL
jgi:hypothetical protein